MLALPPPALDRLIGRLENGLPSGPLATTMMAGPPEAMGQEDLLLALIQKTDHIEAGSDGMRMIGDGLLLIEFQRRATV